MLGRLFSERFGARRNADSQSLAADPTRATPLIRHRTLDVIDDEEIDDAFRGLELESELILERGENRCRKIVWRRS